MQACRRCAGEPLPSDDRSYAAVLVGTGLREAVERIEGARSGVPFVSFLCTRCLRFSVLSFAYHRALLCEGPARAYASPEEHFRALVAMAERHALGEPAELVSAEHEDEDPRDRQRGVRAGVQR